MARIYIIQDNQIMTKEEMEERNFSTDKYGRIIDDNGNEYRNEEGLCMYLETETARK